MITCSELVSGTAAGIESPQQLCHFTLRIAISKDSAIFTINITNVTTCLGSPAVFTCVISESLPLLWMINGTQLLSPPATTPLTPGPGSQSTLSVTATSELNGAPVQCYYTPSVLLPSIVSPPAYLSVQAPPSAPTNLTTTALNATSVLLAWGPPFGAQSPSHFYRVLVTSSNGTLVYNKTVTELQLILTTPDPCDQYWANVTAVYGNLNSTVCTGNSIIKAINGGPPATITITNTWNVFSKSSRDNVTVNFILPCTPGICNYTITAKAKDDGTPETALDKPCSESEGMINISLSLRPLKHFNVSFTANNAQESTNATISTFSVINVFASISGPQCVYYNDDSPAIGCVVHLNNIASNVTYCKVVMKDLNIPVNTSICNSSYYSNGPLSAGKYIVDAYDIGSDGNVSELPAISGVTLQWSTALQGNLTTSASPGSTSLLVWKRKRVQYGDTVEKGTVWGYTGEGYSMGIQWRRVQYGDTVKKGTVWGYSGEGYSMGIH
eukprot:Em0001g1491a